MMMNDSRAERSWAAHDERAKWLAGTIVEDRRPESPSLGETISGMFIGTRLSRRLKQLTGDGNSRERNDRR